MTGVSLEEIGEGEQALWDEVGRMAYEGSGFALEDCHWPDLCTVRDRAGWCYVVARRDGELAGRMLVADGNLLDVCVAPHLRRRGIGRRLVEQAEEWTRASGEKRLRWFFYVDEKDEGAVAFFKALGFSGPDTYSVLMDLRRPPHAPVVQRYERLLSERFEFRRLTASEEDVELGSRLQGEFFRGFPGFVSVREVIERLLERDFAFFVMEKEGEPAGFVIGASDCRSRNSRCVRTPGEGILTSIAVSERFRRKGLATALCHHLMEYMRAQGNHLFIYGGCGMGSPSMRLAQSLTEETWLIRHLFFGKVVIGGAC